VAAIARRRRTPDPTTRALAAALGAARVIVGTGAMFATGPALRLLGFRSDDGENRALARLAGGRDVALGTLALVAVDDARRLRPITLANAAVDAADAAAFVVALVRGDGIDRAAVLGAGSASLAAVTGLWLAARVEDSW
jgi:hypothetical protein